MADDSSSDEIISLEDLVKTEGASTATVAGAPVPPAPEQADSDIGTNTASDAGSGGGASAAAPSDSVVDIDGLIAVEDPAFGASLKAFHDSVAQEQQAEREAEENAKAGSVEIDSLDLNAIISEERADATATGFRKLVRLGWTRPLRWIKGQVSAGHDLLVRTRTAAIAFAKGGFKASLIGLKSSVLGLITTLKRGLFEFRELPFKAKLLYGVVVLLGLLVVLILKVTFSDSGHFFPKFDGDYLGSFEQVADASYQFPASERLEDLNNPLFHPEHVILLDRIIVNLRDSSGSGNPMGLFEIFIEVSTFDAAVELKDRETEARDIVSRTLEQMPYDEMATASGKNKLKIVLRKALNEFLTQGRVRRVFFKTVVLKP